MTSDQEAMTSSPTLIEAVDSWIVREVRRLRESAPLPDGYYYLFEFFADTDGRPASAYQTHWAGWSKGSPRRELRQASRIDPKAAWELLGKVGITPLVVNDQDSFGILTIFGGFGLVEKRALPTYYPKLEEPETLARDSSGVGFRSLHGLPKSKLQHAPTKKLRMEILKRDQARCLVCGRSPASNADIELHVHHIIPWGTGGLTEELNLVTLCHTCHGGLDPHEDPFVRQLAALVQEEPADYRERLLRYQRALFPGLKDEESA
jgi:hypothetical protein